MKQFALSVLVLFVVSLGLSAQETNVNDNKKKETIEFASTVYEFGEIEYGSDGNCVFSFTNTGDEPILINSVIASCGCTIASWTKEPVKPKEKGEIKVKYNTNIPGAFSKSITVYTNSNPSSFILRINGQVKKNEHQNEEQHTVR